MMAKDNTGAKAAAIALALELYLRDEVHDKESGIITIRRSARSWWNNPALTFRKPPR